MISYDELSAENKERYEDDFAKDNAVPELIPSAALNKLDVYKRQGQHRLANRKDNFKEDS